MQLNIAKSLRTLIFTVRIFLILRECLSLKTSIGVTELLTSLIFFSWALLQTQLPVELPGFPALSNTTLHNFFLFSRLLNKEKYLFLKNPKYLSHLLQCYTVKKLIQQ